MTSSDAFGIYVHWPFCKAKCPYCDFNSHVRHEGVDALSFAKALGTELAWCAQRTPGRTVSSIFFGGGTPSLMPPEAVGHVLDTIGSLWSVSPHVETTLEANPTSIEAENFRGYRAAGVNRVSVGVQALNDEDLKALGRQHSSEEAIAAFRLAAKIFPRVSFDMIYARPNQTPEQWRAELTRALAEQQGHMSLYQLTIEPGTAYFDLYERGRLVTPTDDRAADLYDLTQELTDKAGLANYEISNHARPGQESRHNLLYWRYGEYAGIGPGAHGRLVTPRGRLAQSTEKHPEMWLTVVEADGHGLVEDDVLSSEEQGDEFLLMGLRLSEGILPARFESIRGAPLDAQRIASLKADGMIEDAPDGKLRVTTEGFPVLDAVVADLAS